MSDECVETRVTFNPPCSLLDPRHLSGASSRKRPLTTSDDPSEDHDPHVGVSLGLGENLLLTVLVDIRGSNGINQHCPYELSVHAKKRNIILFSEFYISTLVLVLDNNIYSYLYELDLILNP